VIAALRGQGTLEENDETPTEQETTMAYLLLQVWFASLVGWSAGLMEEARVPKQVEDSARLLWKGLGGEA
jgi:hypothetical protein